MNSDTQLKYDVSVELDGVLTLERPKKAAASAKKITIQ